MRTVQEWVDNGTLKPGDRLPSVRQMSKQSGYSPVTVQHAYGLLESDGVIHARPRSGYFVARQLRTLADFPDAPGRPAAPRRAAAPSPDVVYQIMSEWRRRRLENFGFLGLSPDLFPEQEMGAQLRRALREEAHRPLDGLPFEGDMSLREFIAKRSAPRAGSVTSEDVILAGGGEHALNLCLQATTQPGDTVLIESPSYLSVFTALKRRQLQALEIYSHPKTGIDYDQFRYILDNYNIAACVLMPVHHFPTGVTYASDCMRRIVATAARKKVPIIENDTFGELGHGPLLPPSLKSFDTTDIVIQFGSFAATLGPRYGVSWIINKRLRTRLLEEHFAENPQSGDAALQRAILAYLQKHSYDRHLRKMRGLLSVRARRGLALLSEHLPLACSISRPNGGFMCWIRGPVGFDSLEMARTALDGGLSLLPGPLFSVTGSFRNFTAINLSFDWTAERQALIASFARHFSDTA